MKILHLLSSLAYNGAAKEVLLLGRGLAQTSDLRICVLHEEGPGAAPLRAAGAAVHSLDWNRPLDPLPLWRLHRLLRAFKPDRIHIWRLPALRALALVGRTYLPRCIVSQALPACPARLGRLDRWLLRRAAKIVAGGAAEAQSLQRLGFGPEHVSVIPPGVEIGQTVADAGMLDVPVRPGTDKDVHPPEGASGRRIVCLGNLQPHKGFREALRAADYLTYLFSDLHLYIIGSGPFLPSLNRFQEAGYYQDHMHFLGACEDAAAWLAAADICWVPSLAGHGRQVALEAMAAGRPVIASDLPHLREIIIDGVSGLLVPPGDKTALARRTRQVFLDDGWRRRLGEAARARVREHFAAADFVERCRGLYGAGPSCFFFQTEPRAEFSIATADASRNNALNTAP